MPAPERGAGAVGGAVHKLARTDHPVHELIRARWSPYGFADRPVAPAVLRSLFEAARWAPSSYNEQPWRYIVATREDPEAFGRVLGCLVEANRAWAKHAPVLALGVVCRRFRRNGKDNKAAAHDLGLASASLTLEATARGLAVHQMIGIEPDIARERFGIPGGCEAFTGLAIGYAAERPDLAEPLRERDAGARERLPQAEIVFAGRWGEPARLE